MKILVNIVHPADVNFYRNAARVREKMTETFKYYCTKNLGYITQKLGVIKC